MLSTAILPQYFQKIVYVIPTLADNVVIVPRDYRRIYLRIVTGFAGLGFNPGIYLDGTADSNLFERPSASTVYEYWWDTHNVLVQSEFIVRDITAPGILSIHGVLSLEQQIRRQHDTGRSRKAPAWISNPIRSSAISRPRSYRSGFAIKP